MAVPGLTIACSDATMMFSSQAGSPQRRSHLGNASAPGVQWHAIMPTPNRCQVVTYSPYSHLSTPRRRHAWRKSLPCPSALWTTGSLTTGARPRRVLEAWGSPAPAPAHAQAHAAAVLAPGMCHVDNGMVVDRVREGSRRAGGGRARITPEACVAVFRPIIRWS
jgi:hypothetical protein